MNNTSINKEYRIENINYKDFSFDDNLHGNTIYRIISECSKDVMLELTKYDYHIVDRMVETKINLKKIEDFSIKRRLTVEEEKAEGKNTKDILSIALKSFKNDSRFNLVFDNSNKRVYEKLINEWCNNISDVYVIYYKDIIAGFAEVKYLNQYNNEPFINFAAVDEKYRLSGAALELYSFIVENERNKGYSFLYGCISSQNTAVMNLYSYLGASFQNPKDIYLKGRRENE